MLTEQVLRSLWPRGDSKIPGLIAGIVKSAPRVFAKYGLNSNLTIAHAMAQFTHECGQGLEVVENLDYRAERICQVWPSRFASPAEAAACAHDPKALADRVYNGRMGNRPGTDDGYNYRGRGGSQVTGREGYAKLGAKIGIDLINHPDAINHPDVFLEAAVADFVICGCLEPAKADNVREVTHRLNGGYIGLAEREHWLGLWKAALAHTAEPVPQSTPSPVSKPTTTSPQPHTSPAFMWQRIIEAILKALGFK
jgi:putative chitinase